ncbi:MAG: FAD-dependent oxidoreductase [Bdellovibrionales bacterium]|nr:FAD-dependent oxidoreductase [Bdellovibrionales bacterium]
MSRTRLFALLKNAAQAELKLSRRDFLGQSFLGTAAIVGAMQVGYASRAMSFGKNQKKVLIVGGGLAGLTIAYRLRRNPDFEVEIIEASHRVGGRVHTKLNFNSDGQFCELGAELVDSNHIALKNLTAELGLELQSLVENETLPEMFHIQGQKFTSQDFFPNGKLYQALKNLILRVQKDRSSKDDVYFDQLSLADYLNALRIDQDPILLEIIRIAYRGESGLEAEEQAALLFIEMFAPHTFPPQSGIELFGESDEAFRVRGGSEQIAKALLARVQSTIAIRTRTCAEAIDQTPGGRWLVSVKSGSSARQIPADFVVFAIPYSLLSKIEGIQKVGFSPDLSELVQGLRMGANSKGFFNFKERFWRSALTPFNGSLYTDHPFQQFWETSREQSGTQGLLTHFSGGNQGRSGASHALVQKLDEILPGGGKKLTHMKQVVWTKNPWSMGSYSSPGVGQYLLHQRVHENLQAHLPLGIFLAGEQTSTEFQGFMNGAIESGDKVAEQLAPSRARAQRLISGG